MDLSRGLIARLVVGVGLCVASGLGLRAQTPNAAAIDAPKTFPLHFKTAPQLSNGTIALIEGIADSAGHHFAQLDLGMVQPVAVTLLAKNHAADLLLQVLKDRWDHPLRSGSTNSTGQRQFLVRTQGEMRIMVTAPQPTPYRLVVWLGDDIKLPMNSAFVPMADYRKRHPEPGARFLTWAIVGVAGAIVLLAGVLFIRRRPATAAVAVALVCGVGLGGARVSADTPPVDITVDQFLATQNMRYDLNQVMSQANQRAAWNDELAAFDVRQAGNGSGVRVPTGTISAIARTGPLARIVGNARADGRAMMDAFERFAAADGQYDPDYSPPGAPEVPSSCEGSDACGECYTKAQTDINLMRFNLEKLRATCQGGKDAADYAMKFGDDVSSIHGGLGIAWQAQKLGIMKSVAHLKAACAAKYDGMMSGTEKAVREMDRCEAQYFNNPDWRNRYGFIYDQFLRERYKQEK